MIACCSQCIFIFSPSDSSYCFYDVVSCVKFRFNVEGMSVEGQQMIKYYSYNFQVPVFGTVRSIEMEMMVMAFSVLLSLHHESTTQKVDFSSLL